MEQFFVNYCAQMRTMQMRSIITIMLATVIMTSIIHPSRIGLRRYFLRYFRNWQRYKLSCFALYCVFCVLSFSFLFFYFLFSCEYSYFLVLTRNLYYFKEYQLILLEIRLFIKNFVPIILNLSNMSNIKLIFNRNSKLKICSRLHSVYKDLIFIFNE